MDEADVLEGVALVLPGVRAFRRPGVAALVPTFSLLPELRFCIIPIDFNCGILRGGGGGAEREERRRGAGERHRKGKGRVRERRAA